MRRPKALLELTSDAKEQLEGWFRRRTSAQGGLALRSPTSASDSPPRTNEGTFDPSATPPERQLAEVLTRISNYLHGSVTAPARSQLPTRRLEPALLRRRAARQVIVTHRRPGAGGGRRDPSGRGQPAEGLVIDRKRQSRWRLDIRHNTTRLLCCACIDRPGDRQPTAGCPRVIVDRVGGCLRHHPLAPQLCPGCGAALEAMRVAAYRRAYVDRRELRDGKGGARPFRRVLGGRRCRSRCPRSGAVGL